MGAVMAFIAFYAVCCVVTWAVFLRRYDGRLEGVQPTRADWPIPSTRVRSARRRRSIAASKSASGRVIHSSDPRFMASGWNVPPVDRDDVTRLAQPAASAACSASMCPADNRGPQPWIGSNANEIGLPASSGKRPISG